VDYLVSESLNNLLLAECQEKIAPLTRQVPVILLIKKTHEFYQKSIKITVFEHNVNIILKKIGESDSPAPAFEPPPWAMQFKSKAPQTKLFPVQAIIIKSILTERVEPSRC
jgi:hypothetical protein